jgi:hypothetical protein
MAFSLTARRIALAFLCAAITFPVPAVRAKDFVSNPHGFRFTIPSGFRERPIDISNGITSFIEADWVGGDDPIRIDIRHSGPGYNPAAEPIELAQLKQQKGSTHSLQPRPWKNLELQVVRQEIAISSSKAFVAYVVVFPLVDIGIIINVQGPKKREPEVVQVFGEAFRGFVNTKPAAAVSARLSGGISSSIVEMLINVLVPVAMGALIVFWAVRIRKSRSRSTPR